MEPLKLEELLAASDTTEEELRQRQAELEEKMAQFTAIFKSRVLKTLEAAQKMLSLEQEARQRRALLQRERDKRKKARKQAKASRRANRGK